MTALLWGPAAYAQDEHTPTPEEIENMPVPSDEASKVSAETSAKIPKKKAKAVKVKKASKPKATPQPAPETKPAPEVKTKTKTKTKKKTKPVPKPTPEPAEEEAAESETDSAADADEPESALTADRSAKQRQVYARELAVRSLGLARVSVASAARKYIPKDFELRLGERLVQELQAKTYFEPQLIEGDFDLKTKRTVLESANKKSSTDAILVLRLELEEIKGYLASASGRRIRGLDFKYRVGELDEKNAVSIFTDRIVEGFVQSISYRGFVTAIDKNTATINLGSNHGIKEGDVLELFEFRRPNFNSTHRFLVDVQVKQVTGPSESQVAILEGSPRGARIEPFAKVSFKTSNRAVPALAATDKSIVNGRWWYGFGAELESLGADAAAPRYESRVFRVNGAPFGYVAAGNDVLTLRGSFGSATSDTESLGFFDAQGTYAFYQFGSAQSAWTLSGGGRMLYIRVTPAPGVVSALESTTILSPIAEIKYQYVPRGRIRLVGTGEIFWPIYTNGAAIGALPFAFGAGAGVGLQLAITPKFGFEVFGKVRYLRRPIDGQSGVQERQSMLGAGLQFSF